MKREFGGQGTLDALIERVLKMERLYDRARAVLPELEKAVSSYSELTDSLRELSTYYGGQWKNDFKADENGELPPDLKRGVLSEDGLWSFFEENRQLADEMRRLSEDIKL